MSVGEYNLADEKWICLLSEDGTARKVGFKEAMVRAHEYLDLGGDTRLQDNAILRMMIAMAVTIMYRYDEDGEPSGLTSAKEAEERFRKIWEKGRFSERAIEDYFEKWHDRFYLFGGEYPFYQIGPDQVTWELKKKKDGTMGYTAKLPNGVNMNALKCESVNGLVNSSENRPVVPFKTLSDERASYMEFDEAARWLVYYNAYGDCAPGTNQKIGGKDAPAKKEKDKEKKEKDKEKKEGKEEKADVYAKAKMTLPSRGLLLSPVGDNLFQTIMLASVLFDPSGRRLYKTCAPAWEEEKEIFLEKKAMPDDLARAYTQQARRIILKRDGDHVCGFYVSAGEYYDEETIFQEPAFICKTLKMPEGPMLVIENVDETNKTELWGDIAYVAGTEKAAVSRWVEMLVSEDGFIDEDRKICFRATGIKYGNQSCSVASAYTDKVLVNRAFLMDSEVASDAEKEIKDVKVIGAILRRFGNDCDMCMNGEYNSYEEELKKAKAKKKAPKEKTGFSGRNMEALYFAKMGRKIRELVCGETDIDTVRAEKTALAKNIARDYVDRNAAALLTGKKGPKGITLGKAENTFYMRLSRIEKGRKDG